MSDSNMIMIGGGPEGSPLKIDDLEPGMIVAGVDRESPATEFCINTPTHRTYPTLVLDRIENEGTALAVQLIRLDTNYGIQTARVRQTSGSIAYDNGAPWRWSQFYALGLRTSLTPMDDLLARFIDRNPIDRSSHSLYGPNGIDVAGVLALEKLAKLSLLANPDANTSTPQ